MLKRKKVSSLKDLVDINLIDYTPSEGDVLTYKNGSWKPSPPIGVVIPVAVTNLNASNITQTSLTLSWISSENADNYDIEKNGVFLTNTTSNSYLVTSLTSDTTYVFTVKAKNEMGSSPASSISASTIQSIPQPVTGLQTSNTTQTSISLSWNGSGGASSYDIEKDGSFLINTAFLSYDVTGLISGVQYNFTVKAKNVAGTSAGNTISASTLQAAPSAVSNLISSSVTQTSLSLSWTSSAGATSYDILKNGEFLVNTVPNYFNITGLVKDTEYIFAVKSKNSVGTSTSSFITIRTLPETNNSLIFNLDFTGKAGSTSNTIIDTVNNVSCTLVGAAHDGSDGWLNNLGLFLNSNDYVTIPSNTGTLYNSLSLNTTGVSLEFVAYNASGVMFRTEPSNLRSYISGDSMSTATTTRYTSTDNTDKYFNSGPVYYVDPDTNVNMTLVDSLLGKDELNVIIVRLYPDGRSDMVVNGKSPYTTQKPTDFAQFTDMFSLSPLYLRRDSVAINTGPTTLKSFSIYNKVLSNEESLQIFNNHKNNEALKSVSVFPTSVTIESGENQGLSVVAVPSYYTQRLVNTFESGNAGFVTVNSLGTLTGVNAGQTNVAIKSTYQSQEFNNVVSVTVGTSVTPPPASARTISGISINRKTNSMKVGENFAVMATTLPFDVFNDNIVVWESSNNAVCTINFGVLEAVSAGTATITAYDGTKTYSKSFSVTVTNPVIETITSDKIYNVVLTDYNIKSDNTNSTLTTNGIQNALNYASSNGYRKTIFPLGTYLVSPDVRTISLPTNMIVDFSNSIINIEPNSKTNLGYVMFLFDFVTDTTLMNAKIYGEADSTTLATSNEACLAIEFKEANNSGLDNCTVSKSPGFNIATSLKLVKAGTTGTSINMNNFEVGSIDASGVNDNSITSFSFRSINYLDISGLGSYYMLGYSQGYFGYNYLRSRLYSIFFYDANHNFVTAHMHNLQFYNYDKPSNIKYAKLVIYQDTAPASQDTDFSAVAFLRTGSMPINCFIRNCTFEDNFSCGLAMCGGQNWTIENNSFSRNGKRMPACDIDWEDGWDTMIGDIIRNNTFNSNCGVIFSAGASLTLHNNTFNRSNLVIYGRTQNWRAYNNFFNGKPASVNSLTLACQAESYFSRNTLVSVRYGLTLQHPGASYRIRDTNNTLI